MEPAEKIVGSELAVEANGDASAPNDIRSYIIERLLQNSRSEPTETKHLDRFAKELGEDLVERVRDLLYHKLELDVESVKSGRYTEFVSTSRADDLIAVMTDSVGKTQVMLHFEDRAIALLAPLYFGGKPEKPVMRDNVETTDAEIGILGLFSKLMMRGVTRTTGIKATEINIVPVSEIDRDELPAFGGAITRISLSADENQQFFTLIVPERHLGGTSEHTGDQVAETQVPTKDDVTQSTVAATVQLQAQSTTLKALRELRPGDWLPLAQTSLQASLLVRDREVATGQIGRTGDIYSFKATGPVSSGKGLAANNDRPL